MVFSEGIHLLIALIATSLMIVGIVGIIIPFVPGVFLIWATILSYALLTGLTIVTPSLLGIFSGLLLLMILLDYMGSRSGTRPVKTSVLVIIGAIAIGGFAFWMSHQILAFVLGVFLGAIFMELVQGRESHYKIETPSYTIVGFFGATILKTVIGLTILGLFLQTVLKKG